MRNDPQVPVQRILRTLVRMKMSGEIDEIVRLYIGGEPAAVDKPQTAKNRPGQNPGS